MIRSALVSFSLAIGMTTPVHAGMGWYLMSPPVMSPPSEDEKARVGLDAPLKYWGQDGGFDSAATCERERAKQTDSARERINDLVAKGKPDASSNVMLAQLWAKLSAKCIASDDPRLR